MSPTESRPLPEEDAALDLKGIAAAIWRRRPAVVAVTLAAGLLTFLVVSLIPPRYAAETRVLIENRDLDLTRDRNGPAPDRAVVDQETVASQVQLLTSRDLARRVAEKNRLADRAEFDGSEGGLVDTLLVAVGLGRDPMRVSPEERVVDAFAERLAVYRVEGSRVIVVKFEARDRDLAAAVANSVVAEYMALQAEAKRRASEDQTRWLGEEIQRLRGKVREAEAAVETYRAGSDLFVGENNATIARQQITDLTNSLAAARSEEASATAKAGLLSDLLKNRRSLESAADVLDSDTFRSLRAREIALRSRLSELSVTLLPAHPQVKAIASQIDDIATQQVAEARRILSSLGNDAKVAAARIVSLTDSLNQLKATSAQDNESGVELRALEREAASQRGLLESLLARYRESVARQNADAMPADARVISRASTPVEPSFPKVLPLTVVATLAAFLLTLAWIVAGEFVSGRALAPIRAEQPKGPRVVGERRRAAERETAGREGASEVVGPVDEPASAPAATQGGAGRPDAELSRPASKGLSPERTLETSDPNATSGLPDDSVSNDTAPRRLASRPSGDSLDRIIARRPADEPGLDPLVARFRARIGKLVAAATSRAVDDTRESAGPAERGTAVSVAGAEDAAITEGRGTDASAPAEKFVRAGQADAAAILVAGRDEQREAPIFADATGSAGDAVRAGRSQEATVERAGASVPGGASVVGAAGPARAWRRDDPAVAHDDGVDAHHALPVVELEGLHALLIADGASRVAVMGVGGACGMERMIDGFSRLATEDGSRVVIVDTVPARAGRGGPGLSDMIAGTAVFAEIIRRNPATRAHEIGVGSVPLDPDHLAEGGLETMLDALEHTYDLVVLDLGRMAPDVGRFRLIASADHAVLVGDAEDPDVLRIHDLLVRHGVTRLSVLEAPLDGIGAAA